MKPDFSLICRLLVAPLFFILFISNGYSQSKDRDVDFKYKVDSEKIGNELRYTVIITVTKGEGPFYYELCDKSLALGGKSLRQSEAVYEKRYSFPDLLGSEYYIYVYLSGHEFGRGKKILIK